MKKKTTGANVIGIVRSYSRSVFLSYMDPLRICPLSGSAPWDSGSLRRDVCADHTLEMLCKKAGDRFRREICDMLDQMIKGDFCRQNQIYEDSLYARIQGKLLRFYDIVRETRKISIQDKKTIQELVSRYFPSGKNSHCQY